MTTDEQGRPEPPDVANELDTLVGFLEFHRATLEYKTQGLDATQLNTAAVPPSTMTLGGLFKHLAYVEDYWFTERLLGRPSPPPWDTVDWDADNDWDWHSAVDDDPTRSVPSGTLRSRDRARRFAKPSRTAISTSSPPRESGPSRCAGC